MNFCRPLHLVFLLQFIAVVFKINWLVYVILTLNVMLGFLFLLVINYHIIQSSFRCFEFWYQVCSKWEASSFSVVDHE